MENRQSWLRELIADVDQRKVDTIVTRRGITGRAVPDPVNALLDIYNGYFRALVDMGLVSTAETQQAPAFHPEGWLLPNDAARRWLIAHADVAASENPKADTCVLQRVISTCRELEPIALKIERQLPNDYRSDMQRLSVASPQPMRAPLEAKQASRGYYHEARHAPVRAADANPVLEIELTRRDRAVLSKAWELGTDTVVMQTVTMLDGDIISRIDARYTGEEHAVVRQIHQQAVETSLSTWQRLVQGVLSIFQDLLTRRE